eukprot:Hpha_TRINITY_DN15917_c5_g12::TRINITY_DN15917_c5_g12_i1::g.74911::m.74911
MPAGGFAADKEAVEALLYAWTRDSTGRDVANEDEQRTFDEALESGLSVETDFIFRRMRAGLQCAGTLSRLLPRFNITKLDLQQNLVRDAGCEALSTLLRESGTITYLDLSANDIGPQGAAALAEALPSAKRLQTLLLGSDPDQLQANRIDSLSGALLTDAVRKGRTLTALDLRRNPLGEEGQAAFRHLVDVLEKGSALQILRLQGTGLDTEVATEMARALASNSVIAELGLGGNDLGPSVGAALGASLEERMNKSLRIGLRMLDLRDSMRLSDKGAEPLFRSLGAASAPKQPLPDHQLQVLVLRGCQVTDRACSALAEALRDGAALRQIDFSNNLISSAGCMSLAQALQDNEFLQVLNLSKNKVCDEGAAALASCIESGSALRVLELDDARVGDKGCVALGVALVSNQNILSLRLTGNHISDEAGRAFATMLDKNNTVQRISLYGNQVDHSTSLRIKRVLKRNRDIRQRAEPTRLQKELVWLHYQGLQLEQANEELQNHRVKQRELLKELQLSDEAFQQERNESTRRIKELNERIAQEQQELKELQNQREARRSEFDKFKQRHAEDVEALEIRVQEEQKKRDEVQAELKQKSDELQSLEEQRKAEESRLRDKIKEVREDTKKWEDKTEDYKARLAAVNGKLKALEEQEQEAAAAKKAEKEGKGGKRKKSLSGS